MPQELTVYEAALQRRSTRSFKTDPIPGPVLEKLLEAVHAAPSSFNLQPTRVVLLTDPAKKQALCEVSWNQQQLVQAPLVMVFAASLNGWRGHFDAMIQQALDCGGWNETKAGMVRSAAPGFQEALGEKLREYAIKDAMISATHAALAAESLGLATCYMNGWQEDGVREVIGAAGNDDIAIALVLPVGYPLETPKNPGRLPREKVFFNEQLQ